MGGTLPHTSPEDDERLSDASSASTQWGGSRATLLPTCCVCGSIRDQTDGRREEARWVSLAAYRAAHSVEPANLLFTHTYCPPCLKHTREAMLGHVRQG